MLKVYMGPIGVFDSGYGGLTVLKEIVKVLPDYDYLYLGDNGRAPYGTRSFDTVYEYTLECVKYLFSKGCPLVILACNTASAKALRTIQQFDLEKIGTEKRVLGVIRPTSEIIGNFTKTNRVGVLATSGTVNSLSYQIEIHKFYPEIKVFQQACPMWVPLIENNEHEGEGADYFVKKNLDKLFSMSSDIDVVLLACTHYPLLISKIQKYLPPNISVLSQGEIVANSLKDYLDRHPEIEEKITPFGERSFLTTDSSETFNTQATVFFGDIVKAGHLKL